jgi:hypothetical protein
MGFVSATMGTAEQASLPDVSFAAIRRLCLRTR